MRPRTVLAVLCAVGALVLGVVGGRAVARSHRIQVTVVADGRTRTVEVSDDHTVTSLLILVGAAPLDGRLLSVSGQVLDPVADPATITLDGVPVDPTTAVPDGAVLTATDGTDRREGLETRRRAVPTGPLPPVLRTVHRRGRPGEEEVTVGAESGEVVDRRVLTEPVAPSKVEGPVVALTFDDGPNPAWTPYVLSVLADRGVRAAFCMVGEQALRHPEVARAVREGGHEICNRTPDPDGGGQPSPEQVQSDIEAGIADLRQVLGDDVAIPYYRAPAGSLDDAAIDIATDHHDVVLGWALDSEDWRRPTADDLVRRVVDEVQPGSIILLHDGGGDRSATAAALPRIIDELRARGFRFAVPLAAPR